MAKAVGIDLGTTNSVVAATMEGGQAEVIPNAEGAADDAVGGRLHRGRRAAGRPGRQAPGDPQPRGDDLLGEAVHRPQVGRGRRGGEDRLLQGRQGAQRRRPLRGARQAVRAGGDLGAGAAQARRRRRRSSSARRSPRRSSPSRPTSTTPSARRPRTPARSPASRCCGSSTSRPRPRSPTGSTRRAQETVLVFDLGGGTFDVSLLDVGDGVVEVRATSGDGHLGGDDFDKRIVDWLADEFKSDQGIDLRDGPAGAAAPLRGGRAGQGRALVDHHRRRSTCRSSPPTRPVRSTST